ncbi:MAG: NIPSNAP family protein [Candidatus Melainabacteria bacterium]|nr:NIPSNAP family protein [Candidatus Melainabacteria bacterium]
MTGQILLSKRSEFFRLHSEMLLPMMKEVGIRPLALLITEIGHYGKFLDIYIYSSLADYEQKTNQLLQDPRMAPYYAAVGQCIAGSIQVEIMADLPYAKHWVD